MYMSGGAKRLPTKPKPLTRADKLIYALGAIVFVVVCLVYLGLKLEWTFLESLRFILGIVLLWGPFALLCFAVLEDRIEETDVRLCLSLVASYTLSTAIYFVCSVLGLRSGFFILQGVAVLVAAIMIWRRSRPMSLFTLVKRSFHPNWLLLLILSASLVVNIHYQIPFEVQPDSGNWVYKIFGDHLYESGLSAELERHVPPLQSIEVGGLPERAYHMFPHLTTALIALYSGQDDMLRVHIVYHYIAIELLLCLVPYALGKVLTRSNVGGYIAALLMYLLTYSFPPIVPNNIGYFYFTLFPHMSSGLQPMALTSPQMYSSIVVLYATLLGMALVARHYFDELPHDLLLFLTALFVVAGFRFRIQMFIGVAPAFLLMVGYMWLRRRRRFYLFVAGLTVILSGLIYLEMSSPVYLRFTADVGIGYNGLTANPDFFINSWPFAPNVLAWVNQTFADTNLRQWVWQIISFPSFTLLNVIGIPLLLATLYCYLRKNLRQGLALYNWFTLLTIVITMVGSVVIVTTYDLYSVAGQMPFETRWYIFPFAAVVIYNLLHWLQKYLRLAPRVWIGLTIVCVIAAYQLNLNNNPDTISQALLTTPSTILKGQYETLIYIREHTPPESVIMEANGMFHGSVNNAISGIGGRAAYYEGSFLVGFALAVAQQDRPAIVDHLWATDDPLEFCQTLRATPATHLLIDMGGPPVVLAQQTCIQRVWISSDGIYTLWQVNR